MPRGGAAEAISSFQLTVQDIADTISSECGSILEMNEPLNSLRIKLKELAVDSCPLLVGRFKLYPDVEVHIDGMYDALLTPTPTDATTQTYLEALMHILKLTLERKAADQLPGGRYSTPSESAKKSASNVQTTNIIR